ncbi:MAG: RHS repeat-associated core domain-containing protein, partial [Candidatus Nanopelagicales bacterium]|nr:RHS repeat-associated core domain-containing protein [Candidatus Nanopelagicales bacterium]
VVSPHGDNTNTLPLTDNQTSTRVGAGDGTIDGLDLDVWELYDAYGHPINNTVGTSGVANTLQATGSAASVTASGGDRYGWLGAYQRPTSQATGLIQMGARPYNPNTGQFLSTDPIRGGNQNPYTYPVDPVNQDDVGGMDGLTSGGFKQMLAICEVTAPWDCGSVRDVTMYVNDRSSIWDTRMKARHVARGHPGSHWTSTYWQNKANARRHFIWNIFLLAKTSSRTARLMTEAHEFGESGADTNRDTINNQRAQTNFHEWAAPKRGMSDPGLFRRARKLFNGLWRGHRNFFACTYRLGFLSRVSNCSSRGR